MEVIEILQEEEELKEEVEVEEEEVVHPILEEEDQGEGSKVIDHHSETEIEDKEGVVTNKESEVRIQRALVRL